MSFYKIHPLGISASKLVEEDADERRFQKHREKIAHPPPPRIDDNPPAVYPHLELRLKALKLEEMRVNRVDDENRRLLRRLVQTMDAPARVDCFNRNWEPRPNSNNIRRKQRSLSIVKANERLVEKILDAKSHFDWHAMERDWKTHERTLRQLSKYRHPWRDSERKKQESGQSSRHQKILPNRQPQLHPNHLDVLQQKIDTMDVLTKLPSLSPSTLANSLDSVARTNSQTQSFDPTSDSQASY